MLTTDDVFVFPPGKGFSITFSITQLSANVDMWPKKWSMAEIEGLCVGILMISQSRPDILQMEWFFHLEPVFPGADRTITTWDAPLNSILHELSHGENRMKKFLSVQKLEGVWLPHPPPWAVKLRFYVGRYRVNFQTLESAQEFCGTLAW